MFFEGESIACEASVLSAKLHGSKTYLAPRRCIKLGVADVWGVCDELGARLLCMYVRANANNCLFL